MSVTADARILVQPFGSLDLDDIGAEIGQHAAAGGPRPDPRQIQHDVHGDARFGIPAARLGLGYDFRDLAIVAAAIGAQGAAEMLYSARYFDAAEAKACGLVARVLEPDDLGPAVDDPAQAIAANAPLTIRAAKAGLRALRVQPLAEAEARVRDLVATCFASADYAEGRAAFAARRAPLFQER